MMHGRRLVSLAVAVAGVAVPAPAQAALHWSRCEESDFACARLSVPLDRTGTVAGKVSLQVARDPSRARTPQEDVTLFLGGQPGESAIQLFAGEYTLSALVEVLRASLPRGNRVVILDQRGTGGSGALNCRDLQAATVTDLGREAEACAALLGSRRGFYRTSDSVADVEAVRLALGAPRLSIFGAGYGAYVAQQYALAYPASVERLVLDSPVDAAGQDPLRLDSIAAARRVLRLTCRRGCPFTRDPVADTERLAQAIGAAPLRGYVVGGDGRRRPATLSPQELFFTLLDADADLFGRLDYPAAVVSALRGDRAPLFRLKHRAAVGLKGISPEVSSAATRAAVLCEEVRFPWAWQAGPGERAAAADAAAAGLSADLTRPFGPAAAARSDLMRLCRRWPTASAAPPPEPGAMPDVPVLVVGATGQIATPLETARRTARRFARAQLLVTQDVFGASLTGVSGCLVRALERFMRDRDAAGRCGAKGPPLRPGLPVPRSVDRLRAVRDVPGRRGRVLHAFELTLSEWYGDIYAALLNGPAGFLERSELRGGGLRGGRWALGRDQVVLDRYEFIPGVRISLAERASAKHVSVTVDGPGRLDGRLAVSGTDDDDDLEYVVRGHLGGQRIRARLRLQSRLLDAISVGSVASATP